MEVIDIYSWKSREWENYIVIDALRIFISWGFLFLQALQSVNRVKMIKFQITNKKIFRLFDFSLKKLFCRFQVQFI